VSVYRLQRDERKFAELSVTLPLYLCINLVYPSMAKPDIRRESRFFHTPPVFDAAVNFNSFEYRLDGGAVQDALYRRKSKFLTKLKYTTSSNLLYQAVRRTCRASEIYVVMHCLERVLLVFFCIVCVNFISLRIVLMMYFQCLFVITYHVLVNKDYQRHTVSDGDVALERGRGGPRGRCTYCNWSHRVCRICIFLAYLYEIDFEIQIYARKKVSSCF